MSGEASRRQQLYAAATGPVLGTGCLTRLDPATGGTTTATGTPTPAPATAVGCPPYDRRDVERVVCAADPPGDSLVFEPETQTAALPRADVTCRLVNDRAEEFATNYNNVTLHRYDGEQWWFLGPYAVPQPLHLLPAGETHRHRFTVDNTDLGRVRLPDPADEAVPYHTTRHGLGPGTYAIAIESSSEGPRTRYAAAITLRGDAVPLLAPDTVTDTLADGSRRIVDIDPMFDGEADRLTLTVERRPDPPRDPHPLIDEQLYHPRHVALRAAFAHVSEAVTAVAVRGDDSEIPRNLASGVGPDFIAYGDSTFQLTVDPYAE